MIDCYEVISRVGAEHLYCTEELKFASGNRAVIAIERGVREWDVP